MQRYFLVPLRRERCWNQSSSPFHKHFRVSGECRRRMLNQSLKLPRDSDAFTHGSFFAKPSRKSQQWRQDKQFLEGNECVSSSARWHPSMHLVFVQSRLEEDGVHRARTDGYRFTSDDLWFGLLQGGSGDVYRRRANHQGIFPAQWQDLIGDDRCQSLAFLAHSREHIENFKQARIQSITCIHLTLVAWRR